ncbi:hypothetical protein [Achromobacter xylosoxidans]|uniref:hypothetical protein n=1 Tax=Alcaligenes xylosoxydans xylosoxydans TaxID=85698 RepID=UPI001F1441E1|nr:hypothetical protein [Achromobacter xylosoxidans]
MNGRSFPLRRSLRALLLAGAVAQATPAAALERQEIETTLAAAMTQVVNQYVDPLDSGALTVRGLRALGALPETAAPSRQAGIEQAILAGRQAEGITPPDPHPGRRDPALWRRRAARGGPGCGPARHDDRP